MKSSPKEKLIRRHKKIRAKVRGVSTCPRLSVSRSGRYMRAQLIDDERGITLMAVSDITLEKGTKKERAGKVGSMLAKKAIEQGITKVVFDRGGYRYHGRVAALAESARAAGLQF